MKTLLAVLAPLFLAVSCASYTPQGRISSRPDLYANLNTRDQALVQRGDIARGMTMDAVWLAWGSPSNKFVGDRNGKPQERWIYTLSEPVYTNSFFGSYGYGYGGYGRYGWRGYGVGFGPEVVYEPRLNGSVTFINRKVDSWEHRR